MLRFGRQESNSLRTRQKIPQSSQWVANQKICHAKWITLHGICMALNNLLSRFRNCIWRFESSRPSQPVLSPCRTSVREKCLRCFRMLPREGRSPTSKIGAVGVPIAAIWRHVSNREFSISEICSPRLGSYLVETGLHVRYAGKRTWAACRLIFANDPYLRFPARLRCNTAPAACRYANLYMPRTVARSPRRRWRAQALIDTVLVTMHSGNKPTRLEAFGQAIKTLT